MRPRFKVKALLGNKEDLAGSKVHVKGGESKGCLIKGCLNSTEIPKVGIGSRPGKPQEDVNGEKLTVKKWLIFCDKLQNASCQMGGSEVSSREIPEIELLPSAGK